MKKQEFVTNANKWKMILLIIIPIIFCILGIFFLPKSIIIAFLFFLGSIAFAILISVFRKVFPVKCSGCGGLLGFNNYNP